MSDNEQSRFRFAQGVVISEFGNASLARVFDTVGYDFVIVDCEHGSFDYGEVARLCSVASGLKINVLVRIPEIRREHVAKYLDMGADGVVVPMVSTAAQAREAVRLAKYAPMGVRGITVSRPHFGYQVDDLPGQMAKANRSTKVFIQLETAEAFENLDEILAVDGLAGVFIGPNDLLQDIGAPGRSGDERLLSYVEQAALAARRAGLDSGIITSNIPLLRAGMHAGMTVLCQGSDVGLLMAGARAALGELRALAGE